MKKILTTMLAFLMIIVLVGCGETTNAKVVSKNIEQSTDKLATLITKLDSLSTNDIIIEDISPLSNNISINKKNYSSNQEYKYENGMVSKRIKFGSNTEQQNKENGFVTGTKIKRVYPEQRTYSSNNLTRKSILNNRANIPVNANKIGLTNNDKYSARKLTDNMPATLDENYLLDDNTVDSNNNFNNEDWALYNNPNGQTNQDNSTTQDNITNNQDDIDSGMNYNGNSNEFYRPKYKNNVSDNFSTNNLDNYYGKLRTLYSKCADCISSNAELDNCKSTCKEYINSCKNLASALKNGNLALTDEEINECNKCLNAVNSCMSDINSTNGSINNEAKKLKPLIKSYTTNIDSCLSLYDKIQECIDERIDSLNCCNENLKQIIDILSNGTKVEDNAQNISYRKYQSHRSNVNKTNQLVNNNKNKNMNSKNNLTNKSTNKINNTQNGKANNDKTNINRKSIINNTSNKTNKVNNAINSNIVKQKNINNINQNNRINSQDKLKNQTTNKYDIKRLNSRRDAILSQNQIQENKNDVSNNNMNNKNNNAIANNKIKESRQVNVNNTKNESNTNKEVVKNNQNTNGVNNPSLQNLINHNKNNLQRQNAIRNSNTQPLSNGQNILNNNVIANNNLNNGLGGGLYNYNATNIDTYGMLPKNIDTYQNIYTNIDTYGKDYVYNNNNQNNANNPNTIEEGPVNPNDEYLTNEYQIDYLDKESNNINANNSNDTIINGVNNNASTNNNNNVIDNSSINNNDIQTNNIDNINNETLLNSQINNINTALSMEVTPPSKSVPTTNTNSPLPSPFDPSKMDDMNEKLNRDNTVSSQQENTHTEVKNDEKEKGEDIEKEVIPNANGVYKLNKMARTKDIANDGLSNNLANKITFKKISNN